MAMGMYVCLYLILRCRIILLRIETFGDEIESAEEGMTMIFMDGYGVDD